MGPRRDSLPALTALRFFAALAIFIYHVRDVYPAAHWRPTPPGVFHLTAGVGFFFVLSGFILTYNYLDELRQPTARGVWNFYVARWARIYPVHVLGCLILLPISIPILATGLAGKPVEVVASNGLLYHAFLPWLALKSNVLNAVSWSISAEWFFYLCMPLLIPAFTTGSRARRVAFLLLALTPWLVALAGAAKVFALPTWFGPYRYPPVRLVDFVAGVLLGLYWHRRAAVATTPPSFTRATLAEVGALLFLAATAWVCIRKTLTPAQAFNATWIGVYTPSFALLVWVFARGGGLVSKALVTRPLMYLGEISYSFYMLHWGVLLYAVFHGHRVLLNTRSVGWRWVICFAVTIVVSAACFHLVEIPLRGRLRRLLSFRRAAPTDEVPAALPFPGAAVDERRAA